MLSYYAYERFHAGVETCAVAIDLEDVYKRVPFYCLLYQLLELNIHSVLVNLISVALQRKEAVEGGKWATELTTATIITSSRQCVHSSINR